MNFFDSLNVFKRLTTLESKVRLMAVTEQEFDAALQDLRNAIAEKNGEVSSRFETLTQKIAELEAAVNGLPGIDLTDELASVQAAASEVRSILASPMPDAPASTEA